MQLAGQGTQRHRGKVDSNLDDEDGDLSEEQSDDEGLEDDLDDDEVDDDFDAPEPNEDRIRERAGSPPEEDADDQHPGR